MELIKVERNALVELEISPETIAKMAENYLEITVPENNAGAYKEARAALTTCVKTRTGIDKRRKELGEDARAWVNEVNTAAKQLTAALEPAENHLRGELDREDTRKAAIKAEAERKEQERVNGIRAKISAIQGVTVGLNSLDSRQLNVLAEEIKNIELSGNDFQEFIEEAVVVVAQVKGQILTAIEARIKFETEEAERKAESERLRIQKEEQEAEAKRLEAIRIENERKDREAREKIEAETRKLEEEKAAMERAKQAEINRVEREQREREIAEQARIDALKEAEEKSAREKADAEARAKAEAEESARLEALKPDLEKLEEWKNMILSIELPDIKDPALSSKALRALEKIYAIAQTI